MALDIESTWSKATILIETPDGEISTGFLVSRRSGDQNRGYIVTNKHALDEDSVERRAMRSVRLHINVDNAGTIIGDVVEFPLAHSVEPIWREHPAEEVDVLAIPAGTLQGHRPNLANKFVPEEQFALDHRRRELDITVGEDILVVGYPNGVRQENTNLPIIRQGMIASRIGDALREKFIQDNGELDVKISHGFLIDGATFPGSSGSPVILKPVSGRIVKSHIDLALPPPVLLGIVVRSTFDTIDVKENLVVGFTGLGFAVEVEKIVEVLDLF